MNELGSRAKITLKDSFIEDNWPDILAKSGPHGALNQTLTQWAGQSPQPAVLLLDEIDSLVGDSLIAVLRQIRSGHDKRPQHFPQSVILCGVRDVRDYRIHTKEGKEAITGGSAFNIKAESLRLGNFSQEDVHTLYQQHTQETGQIFTPEALALVWHLTQGQPWLTNALGYEVCFNMPVGQDRHQPVTAEMIRQAKETLIVNRITHLDQLVDKLREERVRRVIEPILAGETGPEFLPTDDVLYVQDLGLIQRQAGQLTIANPIYQEVIPRELTFTTQLTISHQPSWYIKPDGRLDMEKLLAAFQQFFREHSEHWLERFNYKKAGPQLLLQAFCREW